MLFASLKHLLPLCPELVTRLPFGERLGLSHTVSHSEKHLEVFPGAAQIPLRSNDIARLGVVARVVFAAGALTQVRRLADVVDPLVGIEGRNSLLREAEVVRTIVETFFRLRVW